MKRENSTNEGIIKEFNNGNVSIKLDTDILEEINAGHTTARYIVNELLSSLDIYQYGDDFSMGNFTMALSLYNCYSDLVYIMTYYDIVHTLLEGRTLKLYAATPTADDKILIDEI